MKASNIIIGNLYEVKSGHNVTVVKVKAINEKTGGWTCETSKGKRMNIADPKRFVKEATTRKEKAVAEKSVTDRKKPAVKKPTLREFIESKGIKVIPKGRQATSSMRDLDDQHAAGPRIGAIAPAKLIAPDGRLISERKLADSKSRPTGGGSSGAKPTAIQRLVGGPKPLGQMSALSAAHRVLLEAGRPLTVREIMETAISKNYCVLNGKTIFNTFNGGIRKEIKAKGDQSRFVWIDKGLFAAR